MAHSEYVEIKECVPGPGVNLDLGVPSLYSGCHCVGQCEFHTVTDTVKCSCKCAYDRHRLLTAAYFEQTSAPIIECNSNCSCSSDCLNRVTQADPSQHLAIVSTDNKGLGVTSSVALQQGSFIGEYVGEIVSNSVAVERLKLLSSTAKCFTIKYREHCNDRVMTTTIDATHKGNITRFINHSCGPNLVMVPIRSDSVVPRLCLFTCKSINAGDELCFSYSGTSSVVTVGTKKCFCGSQTCIGYLPLEQ